MANKVTFDPVNKIIQVTEAPDGNGNIDIDVKVDIYSDGKEDWKTDATLTKYRFFMRAVGGDPLPGSKALGSTFFLRYGWKIKPYEGDHTLRINGNLYTENGDSPFLPTTGAYTVSIISSVSSLVDSTVQQLPEIQYASFGGGVTLDTTSPYTGTTFPVGTPQEPVNNLDDALLIAEERGLKRLYLVGDFNFNGTQDLTDYIFVGEGRARTTITIGANVTMANVTFSNLSIASGTLDGESTIEDCEIINLDYISGIIERCILSTGTIILGNGASAHFLDCWSGVPGVSTPTIDMGGSGQSLAMRNYNGGIKLVNKSGTEAVSIDMSSGQIKLGADVTGGTILCRGVGTISEDLSSGATVIDEMLNTTTIWREDVSGATSGAGKDLTDAKKKAALAAALSA